MFGISAFLYVVLFCFILFCFVLFLFVLFVFVCTSPSPLGFSGVLFCVFLLSPLSEYYLRISYEMLVD